MLNLGGAFGLVIGMESEYSQIILLDCLIQLKNKVISFMISFCFLIIWFICVDEKNK